MSSIWNYIRKLISSDSKESSKRFVFLYCIVLVLTPITFIYTSEDNFTVVLAEWLTFCSFLVGGAIYHSIKKK